MSNVPVIELLPCPFCGGNASMADIGWLKPLYTIGCNNNACPVESYTSGTEGHDPLIALWNTRIAATSTLQDQVALREAAIRAALCLSNFIGEGMFFERENGDPEDAWTGLVTALGMPDADDDDLSAALAREDDQ